MQQPLGLFVNTCVFPSYSTGWAPRASPSVLLTVLALAWGGGVWKERGNGGREGAGRSRPPSGTIRDAFSTHSAVLGLRGRCLEHHGQHHHAMRAVFLPLWSGEEDQDWQGEAPAVPMSVSTACDGAP